VRILVPWLDAAEGLSARFPAASPYSGVMEPCSRSALRYRGAVLGSGRSPAVIYNTAFAALCSVVGRPVWKKLSPLWRSPACHAIGDDSTGSRNRPCHITRPAGMKPWRRDELQAGEAILSGSTLELFGTREAPTPTSVPERLSERLFSAWFVFLFCRRGLRWVVLHTLPTARILLVYFLFQGHSGWTLC